MAQEVHDPALSNPKAAKLQSDAEKLASKFDWFGATKDKNQEDASEGFIKAGAQWKQTKHFQRAGDCFKRAAECLMCVGNQVEANTQWKEAGKCYRNIDSNLAIDAYNHAIQHFLDEGKFTQAARLHEEIAEMLNEDAKYEESIQQYEKAIDYYETERDDTSANKRILIVAHMSAKIKKYDRAIALFEKSAKFNADNNLLRWNVKTLLFKAMLCQLNNAAERDDPKLWHEISPVLEKYRNMNDLFAQSREFQLCEALATAVPKCDIDGYRNAVTVYDSIVRLEPWATDQLLGMEEYITKKQHEAPDLGGGEQPAPNMDIDVDIELNTGGGANPIDLESKEDFENAPDIMHGENES